jgi:hypothetical protein
MPIYGYPIHWRSSSSKGGASPHIATSAIGTDALAVRELERRDNHTFVDAHQLQFLKSGGYHRSGTSTFMYSINSTRPQNHG